MQSVLVAGSRQVSIIFVYLREFISHIEAYHRPNPDLMTARTSCSIPANGSLCLVRRSLSVSTSRASLDALQSPKKSAHSPKQPTTTAMSPTAVAASPSQLSLDEPQLSKVAILLAIEKVDAEIEAVNSKLAAFTIRLEEDKSRYRLIVESPLLVGGKHRKALIFCPCAMRCFVS